MAQTRLISDLVALVTPNNDDLFVVVDNTTNPSQSVTKKITFANLKEALQDMVDLLITEGNGVSATYNDASNTITLSVVPNTTVQKTVFTNSGSTVGTRKELNLIPGAGVSFVSTDDSGNDRVNWTINTNTVSTASGLVGSGTTYSALSGVTTLGDGTKRLDIRALKAGSNKLSVGLTDDNQSIVYDVVPGNIDINTFAVGSPLAVAKGGTAGTTAETARDGIGAAAAGANSDITSLSGMTTPLSISQGGTGGQNAQDALFSIEGISYAANVGGTGQSLIVNGKASVAGEYRAEFKSVRAGSSKVTVGTVSSAISIDVDADNVLNGASQNVNFNAFRLTNIAEPVSENDAATKGYADAVAQGLVVKEATRLASTANFVGTYYNSVNTVTSVDIGNNQLTIASHSFDTGHRVYIDSTNALPTGYVANTEYFVIDTSANTLKLATSAANASSGIAIDITDTGSGTITVRHTLYLVAGSNGALSVDGTSPSVGNRLLLKDQTTQTQNGIYVVTQVGDGSSPAILTRAADANASSELSAGTFTFISEGATNGGIAFVQVTQNAILDVSPIVWTIFSASAIPVNSVDNTKLAHMATGTIKGRALGIGSGDPQDLTANQLVAIVNTATDAIDCGTY